MLDDSPRSYDVEAHEASLVDLEYIRLSTCFDDQQCSIVDVDGSPSFVVDKKTAQAFFEAVCRLGLALKPYVEYERLVEVFEEIQRVEAVSRCNLQCNINVYGPKSESWLHLRES